MSDPTFEELLLKLNKNYNILREREAKYSTAAPIDLLNQIDDYSHAIELTKQAIEHGELSTDELQSEFSGLNLQIEAVVFVPQEPPRKPFTGQNPYRGLHKFTEDDAEFFFGRNDAIEKLLTQIKQILKSETSHQHPNLLTVLGPSGSGKSSLVRAGLIPALRNNRIEGSNKWLISVMVPGPRPLDTLAGQFVKLTRRGLPSVRADLDTGSKALYQLMSEGLINQPENAVFVLVIDQFEEVFTLCEDEAERQSFIDQLLYASQISHNSSLIILTMRADFYGKVAIHKSLSEVITGNQMLVGPMTEKELREAILLPAEKVGLELDRALSEALIYDTSQAPGALPLLQHALLELFERRNGNLLTLDAYHEIGGVKRALAHRADNVLSELSPDQQQIVRQIFMRLIRLGEGDLDTRRRATLDEVISLNSRPGEIENIIKKLADANLLVTDRNLENDQVTLDVAHEALIQEWPTLQNWLDENRAGLRLHQQLSEAAIEWEQANRDASYLYQGAQLARVEQWGRTNSNLLNAQEQAFLQNGLSTRRQRRLKQVGLTFFAIAAVAIGVFITAQLLTKSTINWSAEPGLPGASISTLVWDANGTMYVGLGEKKGPCNNSGIARSYDGNVWQCLDLPGTFTRFIMVDPNQNGVLYASLKEKSMFISHDNGNSWLPFGQGLQTRDISALAISPTGIMYASDQGDYTKEVGLGVFVSSDDGQSWQSLDGSPQTSIHTMAWLDDRLWVGTSDGLWQWTQDGSWHHIIDDPLWITSIRKAGNDIVAGGDAIFLLSKGSQPEEIATESIWNLDVVVQDEFNFVAGTTGGDIVRWQPGNSQLEAVSDNTEMKNVGSVFTVRIQPDNPKQIWAGTDNGVFQGEIRFR